MTDNNQRVNEQAGDTQVACDAFLAWLQSRGPLGPGAISERIFFAGWHAGKRHAAIEQAAPEAPAAASDLPKGWTKFTPEQKKQRAIDIEAAKQRTAALAKQSTRENTNG